MSNVFTKFSQEINFAPTDSFKDISITSAKLEDVTNIFKINFKNNEIIPFEEMLTFITCINKNFRYKTDFIFAIAAPLYESTNLNKYATWIIEFLLKKPSLKKIYDAAKKTLTQEGLLTIELKSSSAIENFKNIDKDFTRIIKKFGFIDFKLKTHFDDSGEALLDNDKKIQEENAKIALSALNASKDDDSKSFKSKGYKYEEVEIHDLETSNLQRVIVKGKIFKIKHLVTKNNFNIFTISITNDKDAIDVKVFASKPAQVEQASAFKENEWIEVMGTYQMDPYSKTNIISSNNIKEIKNKIKVRLDEAITKRVELSARTRFSTMDGIIDAKELVARAEKYGHSAIAIIDSDSVQSFPEFYSSTKNSPIKPIYGVSLRMMDKDHYAIVNPIDKELGDEKYIVFDLETTGLSAHYDDIIEFGAAIMQNGKVIDKKQFFVKPSKPIPKKISKITNIFDENVENAKPESEAIKDIRDYLEQGTMVAHNAPFDYNFVNSKLAKYGYEPLTKPIIDTIVIARITLPKAKRFNLQAVSKQYKVIYDGIDAHRADYDADVLAKVWSQMIGDLNELGIKTQKELSEYRSEVLYSKAFSNEVSIIAKNQKGLKELFQITSKALTNNLYKGATVFYDEIKEYKNIMLGSSALKSKLVDLMLNGTRENIIKEISKYDYIEIQPPQNFKHKLSDMKETEIHDAIKFVIAESKKQNKIVVATGDVRYLDISDKMYHEVYIAAKGLGGAMHYLKKYGVEDPVYPDQHFLTTDEMKEQFNFLEDIQLINEVVVENTNKIADMIDEDIQIIKDKLYTPLFKDADKKLTDLVYKNAYAKYGKPLPDIVEKRIVKELKPIIDYGFGVIYWISYLLVHKSLQDGYLVGSRGSVGSSFVATMSEITEVNPLEPHYVCDKCQYSEFHGDSNLNSGYDLLDKECPTCKIPLQKEGQKIPFETFLGFNADKVPDIDLNFSGEYQPIIHQEVKNIFGEDHSFRAGTISTVAEKTAFGYVRAWAEGQNKELSKNFIEYMAKKVAGTKRTSGQHPGGIIVIPKDMDVEDFSPINFPANDKSSLWKTTHFDFHAIHDNVLKLDLLGHDDPTAIKYLEKLTGVDVKKDIKFSDEKIIELFSSTTPLGIKPEDIDGESTGVMGVPEFGTTFVRRMLKSAKVKSFGDLISVSGLSHGTDVWTGNAEVVIKKEKKELSDVISCRDNIMTDLMSKNIDPLESFQIMEKVRKGKGISDEEEKMLKKHNVEDWYIESLQKIKYMFPKAHATAYVMMAWRIAWFKLYHPVAYYATYFTARADVFDIESVVKGKQDILHKLRDFKSRKNNRGEHALSNKEIALIPIYEIVLEAIARGVQIRNIDINISAANDWIIDKETQEIIPPLSSLDGLGDAVAEKIVTARNEFEFQSIEDLRKRTSITKTSIDKLRLMGVLKEFSESNQLELNLFDI